MQQFDFQKTINMLQRGKNDPTNIITDNEWRRCFFYNNSINLISTTYDNTVIAQNAAPNVPNSALRIKVLEGNMPYKNACDLIEYTLGFDDPFLMAHVNELPNADKLQDAAGLNIPGYPDLFEAIIQVIMGQQISVVVANSVRARFTIHLGDIINYDGKEYFCFPRPQKIVQQSIEELRALGLSNNKCKSVLAVAQAFIDNQDVLQLNIASEPALVRRVLTSLYGVGNWTVDWLLMRYFRRFEFIPEGDLAVQKAFTWWLDEPALMSAATVKQFEKEFHPFGGSVAFRVLYAYTSNLHRPTD